MAGHDGFELVTGHFHSIAKAGEFRATSRGVELWPPSGLALYPIAVVDGLKARIAELERYVGVVERHLSQALGVPAKALGDLFTPAVASAQQKAPTGIHPTAEQIIGDAYKRIAVDCNAMANAQLRSLGNAATHAKLERETVAKRNAALAESLTQSQALATLKVLTAHTVALAKDAGCRVEEAEPATHAKPFPVKAMR